MLNCKQGDLAIVVRSYAGNEGKIVQCLRLIPAWGRIGPDFRWKVGPAWETDRYFVKVGGSVGNITADDQLRPLRGSDGEDEMLRLVSKPADSLVGA